MLVLHIIALKGPSERCGWGGSMGDVQDFFADHLTLIQPGGGWYGGGGLQDFSVSPSPWF